ncbi:MAG TPA: hypothetical protein PL072_04835 [Phycisphaerales bacterium]|nr:hypothetical protein [Phycisphaerales bacterium]
MAQALRSTGDRAEADKVEARAKAAWNKSDIRPGPSCLCVPGSGGK